MKWSVSSNIVQNMNIYRLLCFLLLFVGSAQSCQDESQQGDELRGGTRDQHNLDPDVVQEDAVAVRILKAPFSTGRPADLKEGRVARELCHGRPDRVFRDRFLVEEEAALVIVPRKDSHWLQSVQEVGRGFRG